MAWHNRFRYGDCHSGRSRDTLGRVPSANHPPPHHHYRILERRIKICLCAVVSLVGGVGLCERSQYVGLSLGLLFARRSPRKCCTVCTFWDVHVYFASMAWHDRFRYGDCHSWRSRDTLGSLPSRPHPPPHPPAACSVNDESKSASVLFSHSWAVSASANGRST